MASLFIEGGGCSLVYLQAAKFPSMAVLDLLKCGMNAIVIVFTVLMIIIIVHSK